MKRLLVFILVFVLFLSVLVIGSLPYAEATTGMAFYGNIKTYRNVQYMVDVAKEGNTEYIASTHAVYKYVNGVLKGTYNLTSSYYVLRVYPHGPDKLWVVAKITRNSQKYLYVILVDKRTMRMLRYVSYKFAVNEEPKRIDIEFLGKIISTSPLKTEIHRVIVLMRFPSSDKSSLVLVEAGPSGNTLAIKRNRLFTGIYAVDSPSLFSSYMYLLYYGKVSHKMKIYKLNPNDLSVSYTGRGFSIGLINDADMEMKGTERAYITTIQSSGASFISVNMTSGALRSKTFASSGISLLWGMAMRGNYVVSVFGGSGGTYIALWNDGSYYYLKSSTYSYSIRGRVQVDTGYGIPNGIFIPLGLQRYNGYIVQWHKGRISVPSVSLKDVSTYARRSDGCYYTYINRVSLRVFDNVLGLLQVIDRTNSNTVMGGFMLHGDGQVRYLNLHLSSRKRYVLGFANSVSLRYYKLLGSTTTSWKGYSSSSICLLYTEARPPAISVYPTRTTANRVKLRVSSYIPSKHKIVVRVSGASTYTTSVTLSQGGVRTIYLNLPKAGNYTVVAYALVKSGPYTVNSGYSNSVNVTRYVTINNPTVNTATRTYMRSHVMKVHVAKTGTLEVKEGSKLYTFKVSAGDNQITVPLKNRGTHTIQVRLCVSGNCSSWKSYNVELYDYIEMWIDKKSYMLNGSSATMDTAPFIDPSVSRTVVPLRFILEGLSFDVKWNGTERTITIKGKVSSGTRTVIVSMPKSSAEMRGRYKVYPGSTTVVVTDSSGTHVIDMKNYQGQNMGVPFIYNSRTFVPVRFISEIFEAKVGWDGAERKVTIER
jgi:hypothetical protein